MSIGLTPHIDFPNGPPPAQMTFLMSNGRMLVLKYFS